MCLIPRVALLTFVMCACALNHPRSTEFDASGVDTAQRDVPAPDRVDAPSVFDIVDATPDVARDALVDVPMDVLSDFTADTPRDIVADVTIDTERNVVDVFDVTPVDTGPMCSASEFVCGGRCVNPLTNDAHCGRCSNACLSPETCIGGSCSCMGGLRACGGMCVDLLSNAAHCGACGNVCAAGQSCVDGACTCPSGGTWCGACVDTQTNPMHCGRCDNACGAATCVAGTCTCPAGLTLCAGRCVATQTDTANCGACGVACATGRACRGGACDSVVTCTMNRGDCNGDPADMCETDLGSAAQHCGRCGNACPFGQQCNNGSCRPLASCREIRNMFPTAPSGTYVIRPTTTDRSVWCDMSTAGGGWTVIYRWPGSAPRPVTMMLTYTVNDLAIPNAATSALLAYRNDANDVSDPNWAHFPIPSDWRNGAPFRHANIDRMVMVTTATSVSMQLLRYGYEEFGPDCDAGWEPWRPNGGRICIRGTSAPFFCEFVSNEYGPDRCPNSNQRWDAVTCSSERRFTIAVR